MTLILTLKKIKKLQKLKEQEKIVWYKNRNVIHLSLQIYKILFMHL